MEGVWVGLDAFESVGSGGGRGKYLILVRMSNGAGPGQPLGMA